MTRTIVLWILGLILYFLPAIIAGIRKIEHGGAIFLVNLLFGWTVLGWIGALLFVIEDNASPKASGGH